MSPPRAWSLMIQGTGSDVGKSLLVAGLARALTRRGLRVRPFKPQNMSNNAAVTADGGEIGRAQALQARACQVAPSVHMNPVLLKPQSETGAQIIVQGRVWRSAAATSYRALAPTLLAAVLESYTRLQAEADVVLVEGAGSPAEANLRAGDIANMGFAEAADLPVLLAADASRGGTAAHLVGTHALLSPAERARIIGLLLNKAPLLDHAGLLAAVHRRTGWPSWGVVPWFAEAHHLPAEDAQSLSRESLASGMAQGLHVVVPCLPRLANFDDLDPLRTEPDVRLSFIPPGRPLPRDADLIVVPGSKATLADLAALRREGWDTDILVHARAGGRILGICGGAQMLGDWIADPAGIEGPPGSAPGLGLLRMETVLTQTKTVRPVRLHDRLWGQPVSGYEIHVGQTTGPATAIRWLGEGSAASPDRRILATYVHGLLAADDFRLSLLRWLKPGRRGHHHDWEGRVEETLNALADHLERHVNLEGLLRLCAAFQARAAARTRLGRCPKPPFVFRSLGQP